FFLGPIRFRSAEGSGGAVPQGGMIMLLEKLSQYADRLDLPPSMYAKTPIRWLIDLDKTGELIGFVQTSSEKKRGKLDRGKEYEAPHLAKTSGIKAKLLADNGEYVLGLARDSTTQRRVNDCHRAFVEQVKACLAATQEETLTSIMI